MCNVRLEVTVGQVRTMTAGYTMLSATKRADKHRAECCLFNA